MSAYTTLNWKGRKPAPPRSTPKRCTACSLIHGDVFACPKRGS